MDLVLCIKCWVFPFMLKIPHLLFITVILVSLFLDEYLSITLFAMTAYQVQAFGSQSCKVPNIPDEVAQYLTGSACPGQTPDNTLSLPGHHPHH